MIVTVPGDKSISQRALILSGLAAAAWVARRRLGHSF